MNVSIGRLTPRPSQSGRSWSRVAGITLVELIVVLAIIGILVALLVPAVQRVREAASRSGCANNLRQIAIAVHHFEGAEGRLPYNTQGYQGFMGGDWRNWASQSNQKSWSWLARLLPYLDQEPLYREAHIPDNTLGKSQSEISRGVPVFLCPSDSASAVLTVGNRSNLESIQIGLTNYKGVSGSNWCWGTYANIGPSGNCNGLKFGDGIFFRDDWKTRLRLRDIMDGSSNTFMIGEDLPELDTHCSWPYANNAVGTCAIPPNLGIGTKKINPQSWWYLYSFRSRHPGGLQFALADGSVRFVQQPISFPAYRALATIRGNESVELPWD